MTPELVQVAEQRNVTRLHSVGVALPLGTMATSELIDMAGAIYNRQVAYPEPPEFRQQQLRRDFGAIAAEVRKRKVLINTV